MRKIIKTDSEDLFWKLYQWLRSFARYDMNIIEEREELCFYNNIVVDIGISYLES